MSASALFCLRMVVVPIHYSLSSSSVGGGATKVAPGVGGSVGGVKVVIESSSRPQKKATKHHMKTRPRKSQAWDIRHGPTVYPPLPLLPPEWALVTDDAVAETVVSSPPQLPKTTQ
ncbi:unnamed protein product [Ilex paraguariensis]|uniref:50S ribosomal protein 6, chloroplastic n=1 Tax=Ilex paraguariensis TaxID=185542 RepID=A0ABC8TMD4_9AQUA